MPKKYCAMDSQIDFMKYFEKNIHNKKMLFVLLCKSAANKTSHTINKLYTSCCVKK
jgi:hypothetical protein